MSTSADTTRLSAEELWRRGREIYERDLRQTLEPEHTGEFVVVNVTNGDYFVDTDEDRAIDAAVAQYPDEAFYIGRVGYSTAHRIGIGAQPNE